MRPSRREAVVDAHVDGDAPREDNRQDAKRGEERKEFWGGQTPNPWRSSLGLLASWRFLFSRHTAASAPVTMLGSPAWPKRSTAMPNDWQIDTKTRLLGMPLAPAPRKSR